MADLHASPARQVLHEAAAGVTQVVQALPRDPAEDVWSRPTPCSDWDVRTVLNHLTAEHLWARRLLHQETLADVGGDYDGDVLGADPVSAWEDAIAHSLLSWSSVEDEQRQIELSFGPTTITEYASQMIVDLVVHGWDLARGAGLRYQPAPEAVQVALDYERPRVESGGVAGIFGPPVPTDSADPVDQLVALLGRDPRWSA